MKKLYDMDLPLPGSAELTEQKPVMEITTLIDRMKDLVTIMTETKPKTTVFKEALVKMQQFELAAHVREIEKRFPLSEEQSKAEAFNKALQSVGLNVSTLSNVYLILKVAEKFNEMGMNLDLKTLSKIKAETEKLFL